MSAKRSPGRTYLILIGLVLILAASAYAFAAANTVPVTGAGDASSATSGYAVSGVTYTLGPTNFGVIDKVTFALAAISGAPAPATVKIQLVTGGTWYNCTFTTPSWNCSIAGAVTVAGADTLRVVAAQ